MMKDYVLVDADGWQALYLNGELCCQDDSVELIEWLKDGYDSFEELDGEAPDGAFPEKLSDAIYE